MRIRQTVYHFGGFLTHKIRVEIEDINRRKTDCSAASFMSSLMACTWHLSTLPCRIYGLHSTICCCLCTAKKFRK